MMRVVGRIKEDCPRGKMGSCHIPPTPSGSKETNPPGTCALPGSLERRAAQLLSMSQNESPPGCFFLLGSVFLETKNIFIYLYLFWREDRLILGGRDYYTTELVTTKPAIPNRGSNSTPRFYPTFLPMFFFPQYFPIWRFPEMVVSPKSFLLVALSIINHPFWGTPMTMATPKWFILVIHGFFYMAL